MTLQVVDYVDYDTFMHRYMGQHVELVDGKVVPVRTMPITQIHEDIAAFLRTALSLYLNKTGEGVAHQEFAMRLQPKGNIREPDVLVITNANLGRLENAILQGGADIAVEIVSEDSSIRDRGDKFHEYEAGGVREYWIIDPQRKESLFYVQTEAGYFERHDPDENGIYISRMLPRFAFPVALLYSEQVKDTWQAVELVQKMLA